MDTQIKNLQNNLVGDLSALENRTCYLVRTTMEGFAGLKKGAFIGTIFMDRHERLVLSQNMTNAFLQVYELSSLQWLLLEADTQARVQKIVDEINKP